MSPPVVRRTQAKRDIAQIACFIADENPAAAERFLEAVKASFAALARMPHMGVPRHFRNPKFADVRMWRVRDFDKYLIFYRPRKNGVDIEACSRGTEYRGSV